MNEPDDTDNEPDDDDNPNRHGPADWLDIVILRPNPNGER